MDATGHRVTFTCDDQAVDIECELGESLLTVLRERVGVTSVKDGCAPQGQCGCCTVLVDGDPRVACVTPVERVAGRVVTTLSGLDPELRDRLAGAFVATGGSQCGFCTPGILVRAAALIERGKNSRTDIDRALAAHLCRCTGWQTIYEAIESVVAGDAAPSAAQSRNLDAASARAELEGGVAQLVGIGVPLGVGGFADDGAPHDALVAVPLAPGSDPEPAGAIEAFGVHWVIGETLADARARAGKVQGRRTTLEEAPPLPLPPLPDGGVRLATSWVEPAYLEPDASWCTPGGEPASPLANGGAFGGKVDSRVRETARALADRFGRTVRVVYSREDCVRLGPKRPPIAASAYVGGDVIRVRGRVASGGWAKDALWPWVYKYRVDTDWSAEPVVGPALGGARAVGMAEQAVLVEGALSAAGIDRSTIVRDRFAPVLLDACASTAFDGASAGARVVLNDKGGIERVEVRVAAGDPLDEVVLRSYCIGAAHMALGWVLTEGLAVDPETGDVLDLTIRSFGIIRPARTPPIDVTIIDELGEPQPHASDAVFAAVAAATWNAVTEYEGARPEVWPAANTAAARALRK